MWVGYQSSQLKEIPTTVSLAVYKVIVFGYISVAGAGPSMGSTLRASHVCRTVCCFLRLFWRLLSVNLFQAEVAVALVADPGAHLRSKYLRGAISVS